MMMMKTMAPASPRRDDNHNHRVAIRKPLHYGCCQRDSGSGSPTSSLSRRTPSSFTSSSKYNCFSVVSVLFYFFMSAYNPMIIKGVTAQNNNARSPSPYGSLTNWPSGEPVSGGLATPTQSPTASATLAPSTLQPSTSSSLSSPSTSPTTTSPTTTTTSAPSKEPTLKPSIITPPTSEPTSSPTSSNSENNPVPRTRSPEVVVTPSPSTNPPSNVVAPTAKPRPPPSSAPTPADEDKDDDNNNNNGSESTAPPSIEDSSSSPPPSTPSSSSQVLTASVPLSYTLYVMAEDMVNRTQRVLEQETSQHILREIILYSNNNGNNNESSSSSLSEETLSVAVSVDAQILLPNVVVDDGNTENDNRRQRRRLVHVQQPHPLLPSPRRVVRTLQQDQQQPLNVQMQAKVDYQTSSSSITDYSELAAEWVAQAFNSPEKRQALVTSLLQSNDPSFANLETIQEVLVDGEAPEEVEPSSSSSSALSTSTIVIIVGAVCGGVLVIALVVCGMKKMNACSSSSSQQQQQQSKHHHHHHGRMMNGGTSTSYQIYPPGAAATLSHTSSSGMLLSNDPKFSTEILVNDERQDDISTIGDPFVYGGVMTTLEEQTQSQNYSSSYYNNDSSNSISSRRMMAPSGSGNGRGGDRTSASATLFDDDNSFDQQYNDGDDYTNIMPEEEIEVEAPAGKLGMVIDTPNGGIPVVHALKSESVLADQVQVGDHLVSVDGVDVRGMTALEVSKIISLKADQMRVLMFRRTTAK